MSNWKQKSMFLHWKSFLYSSLAWKRFLFFCHKNLKMMEVLAIATITHSYYFIASIEELIHTYFVPLRNIHWKSLLFLKTDTLVPPLLVKNKAITLLLPSWLTHLCTHTHPIVSPANPWPHRFLDATTKSTFTQKEWILCIFLDHESKT